MRIEFAVDGRLAVFTRSLLTGSARIMVEDETLPVASALAVTTHVRASRTRVDVVEVSGHEVRIESERPRLFAGLRAHDCRILVDGTEVAREHGY